jgi:glycogen operon protein
MTDAMATSTGARRASPAEAVRTRPGVAHPLGATWDGGGVNFSLFSEHATGVELCLYDPADAGREIARIPVRERTDQVWHVYLPDARPGALYGYRVDGPYDPAAGHRFNPAAARPYAKTSRATILPEDLARDDRDNAASIPNSVVVDPAFTWGGVLPLRTPWHRTVIYEVHVKGFTARHPGVPREQRGTYAGLASQPAVEYLTSLGVTAVELLPVHHFVEDRHLVERGLTNYWGYNSIGFLAPDARYSSTGARGEQVREFQTMVKVLHAAGIEVILTVTTTPRRQPSGRPAFRGIDNGPTIGSCRISPATTATTPGAATR